MVKKIIIWLCAVIILVTGCSRKETTPILSEPVSSIYAVSAVCTQVEVNKFPEVRAFVSVVDQNDQPLFDFKVGNFSIAEDGAPVPVKEVKRVDNAIDTLSVALVLDRSGSMEYTGSDDDLTDAAVNFVNQLGTKDEAEVVSFDHTVVVSQGFTTDHNALARGIRDYDALGGATALYDAIGQAVTDLSSRHGRKFILAMTDGLENSSQTYSTLESIKNYANSKGLAVFVVGSGDVDQNSLKQLTDDTGGRFFLSMTPAYLTTIFQNALKQFNNEIEIQFRSLSKGSRHLTIYMNYGKFRKSFEKVYSN